MIQALLVELQVSDNLLQPIILLLQRLHLHKLRSPHTARLLAPVQPGQGRVERANRTLQDRLVKELRLAGVSDMETANAYLTDFMERYNIKFAKPPVKPDNLHRSLNVAPDRLGEIFCLRNKRYVGKCLTTDMSART